MEINIKNTPRDVFLNLLWVGTLYFSSFNLIQLLLELVNAAFPDPLNLFYEPGGSVRWAIASLIIVFPVYAWTTWFINRDVKENPQKAELKVRKWLIYLTLFLAAVLIIGDLIALIFNFLEGELTLRFVLKVLAVLAVGAGVFRYYFYDLRKAAGEFSSGMKLFVWGACAFVALAVIAGFIVAGSPFRQREVRFDSERVGHLQNLQSEIVAYWQLKSKLPAALDDLEDSISGFKASVDPQTGEPYLYNVKAPLTFELCATFNLVSNDTVKGRMAHPVEPFAPVFENWNHPAGSHCFERTIDPERYRVPGKTQP